MPRPARRARRSLSRCSILTLGALTLVIWSSIGQGHSFVGADPTASASRCDPGSPGTPHRNPAQTAAEAARDDPDVQAGFPVTAYETGGTGGGLGTHILVG